MPLNDSLAALKAGARTADQRVAIALVYTAVVLVLEEYFFIPASVVRNGWFDSVPIASPGLVAGLVWAASTLVFFAVIPALIVRLYHRERLGTIGWSMKGVRPHLPLYLLLYALVLPFVYLASTRADFTSTYPFVVGARTDLATFLWWECAYALSFLALEAFFRGYILFTCAARMGWTAVFVMVVPYAMIHFHKPWPEAFGAIAAGVVLGSLALAYRSFWGGVLLHVLVAVSMDVMSVHKGGLF